MQLLAFLPVLTLLALAAPTLAQDHPNGHGHGHSRRRHANAAAANAHHARQAERIVGAVQRREDVDPSVPRALEGRPRLGRRGAAGCRVKGSHSNVTSAVTSASTSTSASASVSVTVSSSTTATTTFIATSVTTAASDAVTSTSTTTETTTTTNAGADYNAQYQVASSAASTAATTTTSFTAAAASASSAVSSSSSSSSSAASSSSTLTPNGKKAGVSAGDTLSALGSHIGWWYNWAPTDEGTTSSSATFVSMLWGGGTVDSTDASRLAEFKALTSVPEWIIGFEEPDCTSGSGSADMSIATSATLWNSLMVPKGEAGSLLLSPSMCHQADEDGWLASFQQLITRDFDITNVHINKNSMDGVKTDLDYYYNKYQKPIWVTEFACVDDSTSFVPCTDQSEIDTFISEIVDLFESDSRVYAYAYSNGDGLGTVWPMWQDGAMTASGDAYLAAISKYH